MGKGYFGEVYPGTWRRCFNCRYGVDNATTDGHQEGWCKRYPKWERIDNDYHYCGEHLFDDKTKEKIGKNWFWGS